MVAIKYATKCSVHFRLATLSRQQHYPHTQAIWEEEIVTFYVALAKGYNSTDLLYTHTRYSIKSEVSTNLFKQVRHDCVVQQVFGRAGQGGISQKHFSMISPAHCNHTASSLARGKWMLQKRSILFRSQVYLFLRIASINGEVVL